MFVMFNILKSKGLKRRFSVIKKDTKKKKLGFYSLVKQTFSQAHR